MSPARSGAAPGRALPRVRRRAAGLLAAGAALAGLSVLAPGLAAGRLLPAALAAPASPPAAEAAVIAAYTSYIAAVQDAEPQPSARAAAILAGYAAQPYLGHVLAQIAAYRQDGELAWGYVTPHIVSVQLSGTGTGAVVRDCQDAGNAWLVAAATGTVVPGSTGSPRTLLVAVLARAENGKWLVTLLARLPGTCSRVPSPP
jgi:hypothetical protein